jgi:thioredoxin reductase (NADPH)
MSSDRSEPRSVRCLIVGSGPAGYTAAVYAARASLNPLLFEGAVTAGGALMNTTEVENFPGFRDGIMGPQLMDEMRAQAERFGTEIVTDDVTAVDLTGAIKKVTDGDGNVHHAYTVILATGSGYKKLGIPDEDRLSGHGVSWCATCDGFFFRDQEIAVVGGGDSALEEATFLTKFADKVTVIHRRKELRASKIMQDRAFRNEKIDFIWDTVVTDLEGDTKLTGAKLRNVVSGEESVLPVAGLFVAIGHVPNTDLFQGQLEMDEAGYLITQNGMNTSVEGVFACGDVQDHTYRQAITAAGTGCMAAIDAERWLESHEHESDIGETPRNW